MRLLPLLLLVLAVSGTAFAQLMISGLDFTCGISDADGSAVCFGADNQHGQLEPPGKELVCDRTKDFAQPYFHITIPNSWATQDESEAWCKTKNIGYGVAYQQINDGFGTVYCLQMTGQATNVHNSGKMYGGVCLPSADAVLFSSLGGYGYGKKRSACGVTADTGRVRCWGEPSTTGNGRNIAAGYAADGTDDDPWPSIAFSQVAQGNGYACGLRADNGHALCWGHSWGGGGAKNPPDPEEGDDFAGFVQIATGSGHTWCVQALPFAVHAVFLFAFSCTLKLTSCFPRFSFPALPQRHPRGGWIPRMLGGLRIVFMLHLPSVLDWLL